MPFAVNLMLNLSVIYPFANFSGDHEGNAVYVGSAASMHKLLLTFIDWLNVCWSVVLTQFKTNCALCARGQGETPQT